MAAFSLSLSPTSLRPRVSGDVVITDQSVHWFCFQNVLIPCPFVPTIVPANGGRSGSDLSNEVNFKYV